MKRILVTIAVLFVSLRPCHAQENPGSVMKKHYETLRPWLADTAAIRKENSGETHRLDDLFDWKEMTLRVFPENWVNLTKQWQASFVQGARKKVIGKFSDYLLAHRETVRGHSLSWREDEVRGTRGKVFLDVIADQEISRVTLRVTELSDAWKIYDIRSEKFSLQKSFFQGLDSLLSEGYHPEYVFAVMMDLPEFFVDEFSGRSPDGFPLNWGWRKKDDRMIRNASESFQILDEDRNRYLRIHISDVLLVRPFCMNIFDYPVLKWKWRLASSARQGLPPKTVLASLTVIFYQNWLGLPVTVTYAWHGRDARCTSYHERQWFADRYTVVLRGFSGQDSSWVEESVHLVNDYGRFFGEEPPSQTVGLYFQIHRNGSERNMYLDVDDIRAMKTKKNFSCP